MARRSRMENWLPSTSKPATVFFLGSTRVARPSIRADAGLYSRKCVRLAGVPLPAPSSSAELHEKAFRRLGGAAPVMVLQLFLLTRIGDDAVAFGLFLRFTTMRSY